MSRPLRVRVSFDLTEDQAAALCLLVSSLLEQRPFGLSLGALKHLDAAVLRGLERYRVRIEK
jgi:hypothetical protein